MNKIRRFIEFIKEEFNDTPESYIGTALTQIKMLISQLFEEKGSDLPNDYDEVEIDATKSSKSAIKHGRSKERGNFKDLGLELQSLEISRSSKINDSLTLKFTDEQVIYVLTLIIELKEGISDDTEKTMNYYDIKECTIKFQEQDRDSYEILKSIRMKVELVWPKNGGNINFKLEGDDGEFGNSLRVEDFFYELKSKLDNK